MHEDNILDYINKVTEVNDTSKYMKDENLDQALALIVKLMFKPEIPKARLTELLVQIESLAATLNAKKVYYTVLDKGPSGSDQNNKKNIYFGVVENLYRISDAIKYMIKGAY